MKTNLLNSSESEVRNNSILYGTEGAASSVVSAVSVPYVSRKSLVSRLMRTAAIVVLLMTVGAGQMWADDYYVLGPDGSWDQNTAHKMVSSGITNWVYKNLTPSGQWTNFKIYNTTTNTWYGKDSGGNNVTIGTEYTPTTAGENIYCDFTSNYSNMSYYFFFNTSTKKLLIVPNYYLAGTCGASNQSWGQTQNAPTYSTSGYFKWNTCTLTAGSEYSFKLCGYSAWTYQFGDASTVSVTKGTKTSSGSGDIKFKSTYSGTAVITFVPTSKTMVIHCPYQITYDKGTNGTGTISSGIKTWGVSFTLSSSTFTRDGYTQDGWSTTDGGNKAYDLGGSYTSNADITLYPHWVETTYDVQVIKTPSTGGSVTPTASWTAMSQVSGGDITATPSTGYSFTKWTITSGTGYFGSTGTNTTSTTANTKFRPTKANTVIKATFTPNDYTITLDGNGGTDGSATATYNASALASITHASRAGYSLNGYYTAESDGSKVINADGSLNNVSGWVSGGYWNKASDGTLYAQWTENAVYYTLSFSAGTGMSGNVTVAAKNSSTSAAISSGASLLSGTGVTITATPATHYKFVGWYSNAACTTQVSTNNPYTFSISGNTTLYAKVEYNTTAITLNRNGGTAGTESVTATYGSALPSFTAHTRTGYTLKGYYTASSDGTMIIEDNGNLVASTDYADATRKWKSDAASLTLYAQWTEKMTTITINASPTGAGTFTVGGSAFTEGNTTTAGVATSRTVVATPISDYTFSSWSVTDNATGTNSTNTYTLKGNGSAGTGTLTANFTLVPCTLYYGSATPLNSPSSAVMSYDIATGAYYKDVTTNASPYYFRFLHSTGSKQWSYNGWGSDGYPDVVEAVANGDKVACDTEVQGWDNKSSIKFTGPTSSSIRIWFDYQNKKAWITEPGYSVTINNGTNGTVSPNGAKTVGASGITITATPAEGYKFVSWTTTGGAHVASSTSKTTTLTATAAGTVTATYTAAQKVKLYYKNTNGWNNVYAYLWDDSNTSDHNADWHGTDITSNTVVYNCETYYYYEFYMDSHNWNRIIFNDGGSNQTSDITFTSANANQYYINDAWVAEPTNPWSLRGSWDEWANASALTCTSATSGYAEVALAANQDYEFKFVENGSNWYGATTVTQITYSNKATAQTMNSTSGSNQTIRTASAGTYRFTWDITNKKVTVTYPTSYTVTYSATTVSGTNGQSAAPTATYNSGAVSVTSGDYVPSGTSVTFTAAAANSGYTFNGWYTAATDGTQKSSALSYSETISANTTRYARYTQNTHTVTLTNESSTYGTVNTSSPVTVGEAEAVQIKATAMTGYKFKAWVKTTGTGTVSYWTAAGTAGSTDASGANNATTYIKVTGDVTLQATYEEYLATGWYLAGTLNHNGSSDIGWTTGKVEFTKQSGHSAESIGYVTKTITPADYSDAGYIMEVKLYNGTTMFGNNGDYTYANNHDQAWDMSSSVDYSLRLHVDYPGTYTFKVDYTTPLSPKLTITFPILKQLQIYDADPAHAAALGNWDLSAPVSNVASTTVSLNANTTYKFKIVYDNVFYGNNGTMRTKDHTDWTMSSSDDDCYITTSTAADYIFNYNTSTHKLTVVYPPDVEWSAASVYSGDAATINVSAWNLTSGQSLKYELFAGATATGTALQTKNVTTSAVTDQTTFTVTPSFGASEISKQYTVRITFAGKQITYTSYVYRKWDIYVQNGREWGTMKYYAWAAGDQKNADYPGVACVKKYESASDTCDWYTATIDGRYSGDSSVSGFLINNGESGDAERKTTNLQTDITVYGENTYWYMYAGSGNSDFYLSTAAVVAPTVSISASTQVRNTSIGVIGKIDNYGGDCVVPKIYLDDVEQTVCRIANNGEFFAEITGLTAGTTHTLKVTATNVMGTSQATRSITLGTGTSRVWVKNSQNWEGDLYCYCWYMNVCSNSATEYIAWRGLTMTNLSGTDWFYCDIPSDYPYFAVSSDVSNKQSADMFIENCDFFNIKSTTTTNSQNQTVYETECTTGPTYYYVETTKGTRHFLSNVVSSPTEIMSFYASSTGTVELHKFEAGTEATGSPFNVKSKISFGSDAGNVYVAKPDGNTIKDVAVYDGDFYLYAQCERANETEDGVTTIHHSSIHTSYANTSAADRERSKFIAFNPDRTRENEYYNHYWVEWLVPGQDIRATVGNQYNSNLSVYLGADKFTTEAGVIPNDMPGTEDQHGYNVRFIYDNYSNMFERNVMEGSTNSTAELYLTMYSPSSAPIYNKATGTTDADKYLDGSPAFFIDASNWAYQSDVYVDKLSEITIVSGIYKNDLSKYGENYPLGITDEDMPKSVRVLSDESTSGKRWKTRLIYDYKTNKIVVGWLVDDDEIDDVIILDGNMMIERVENGSSSDWNAKADIAQLTMGDNGQVQKVKNIYTVLELTKNSWRNSNPYGVFWLSLPYDCHVNDIFGLDGYSNDGYLNGSSKKWFVTRYRGDLRAQIGWWKDISSFWESQWQNYTLPNGELSDDIIPANEGFCLMVQLTDTDFPEIGGVNRLRFFFPSRNETEEYFNIEKETVTNTYDPMIYDKTQHAQTEDRTKKDSNWRCFGVPGYKQMTVTAEGTGLSDYTDRPSTNTMFFYDYDFTKGSVNSAGSSASARYSITSASGYNFLPTYGYMMQFAGTLTWTGSSAASRSVAARRSEAKANRMIELQLIPQADNNDQTEADAYTAWTDRTYINLTENATNDYDMSMDMMKVMNSTDNLYTYSHKGSTQDEREMEYAANNLPVEDAIVPLVLDIKSRSEYQLTINNANSLNGVDVVLVDKVLDKRTPLNSENYTVALEKGKYTDRFELHLQVSEPKDEDENQGQTTSLDDAQADFKVTYADGKLILSGIENTSLMEMFDATGKLVTRRQVSAGDYITAPAAGVYMVRIGSNTQRVIIK